MYFSYVQFSDSFYSNAVLKELDLQLVSIPRNNTSFSILSLGLDVAHGTKRLPTYVI